MFSDVTTSYVIDANSETIIPARLEKLLPEPIIGVLESGTKVSDHYQLHIAASLSLPNSDGMVSLRILNPTDAPVLLHKGTSVGVFSELAPNDTVLSLEPTTCKAVDNSPRLYTQDSENTFLSTFKCLPSKTLSTMENGQLNKLLCEYIGTTQTRGALGISYILVRDENTVN